MIALSSMQESKSDEMHDNEAAFNANRGLVFSSGTQLSYPLSAVERRSATDYSNFEVAPSPQSNIFTTPHDTPFDRMLKTRGGPPRCHAYKSSPPNFFNASISRNPDCHRCPLLSPSRRHTLVICIVKSTWQQSTNQATIPGQMYFNQF